MDGGPCGRPIRDKGRNSAISRLYLHEQSTIISFTVKSNPNFIVVQFTEAAEKGFHIVEHSNCDNCENEEAWHWVKGAGRSTQKKMCWTMDVATHHGTFALPYNCHYNQLSNEECELDTSKSAIHDKLKSKQFVSFLF